MEERLLRILNAADGRLWVTMPPVQEWIQRIRRVQGRTWHPEVKMWSIPDAKETVEELVHHFNSVPVQVASDLLARYPLLQRCSPYGERWRRKFSDALRMKGYSSSTEKAYVSHVERCMQFTGVHIDLMELSHTKKYVLNLLEAKHSHTYVNQAISALRFWFRDVEQRSEGMGQAKAREEAPCRVVC
ncbi:phage integrase N-terminal SAM-like domain-containing protein [Paenibacillus chibensis]|uniref:Phage integrase N-terminal SAM-like domain-containing protein n=1 Tax=Paenibacillus chibensis TaxID=59846 RepID=A0ABU6PPH4_9BACL|nr:phage integrase N-terminal SAM-like domain-containing protein [Paenibacillus chibensis]